jgi:hypothetical protein
MTSELTVNRRKFRRVNSTGAIWLVVFCAMLTFGTLHPELALDVSVRAELHYVF